MGVILNNFMYKSNDEQNDESEKEPKTEDNTKFNDITTLLDKVEREADVFNKFPTLNHVLDIKILAVDGSYRGQGVCKALINKTM